MALYRAISQEAPEKMAAKIAGYRDEGYTKFQLKVGGDPDDDIERIHAAREVLDKGEVLVADANTGWLMHEAARVVDAVADLDVYIEQPCKTYEESLSIRERTARPFVLDENIDGVHMLLRAFGDRAMDVINLKISKVGGLTKARQIRDLCAALGIAMTIEDSWGGDIITSAIAPSGALCAGTVPVLGDRLQLLCDGEQRVRRASARKGHDARRRRAGAQHLAQHGCARRAGRGFTGPDT